MCMISVKPAGINIPDKKSLQNACSKNRDGLGLAHWKAGRLIHIRKDFNSFETFYAYLKNNVKKEDVALIHFRLATHGLKDKGNRHPFPITRNIKRLRTLDLYCKQAVVHNGVIMGYNHKKLSDTQKFVIDILASSKVKNNLQSRVIQKMLAKYIDGDKLAIIDTDGAIILLGEFIKHKGCFYSNDDFKYVMDTKPNIWAQAGCNACFERNKTVEWRRDYQEFLCTRCYNRWETEGFAKILEDDELAHVPNKDDSISSLEDTDSEFDATRQEAYKKDCEGYYECPICYAHLHTAKSINDCPQCGTNLRIYTLIELRRGLIEEEDNL